MKEKVIRMKKYRSPLSGRKQALEWETFQWNKKGIVHKGVGNCEGLVNANK